MKGSKRKFSLFRFVLIIVLLPVVIVWLAIRLFKRKKHDYDSIDFYNVSQIDSLSGVEFENLLKSIFTGLGYEVTLTKKSHDYGADLVLKKNGVCSIVQAKCYEKNIGIKAIQEIISAKKHYGAEEMFVATNRYFSRDAEILAAEHDVRLIDRDVLTKLMRDYMPKIELNERKRVATNDAEKREIEARYRFWI